MIPATHKRLRSIFLMLLLLTILGIALLCQPPLVTGTASTTGATNLNSIATPMLKCYVGSCGMESRTKP